MNKQDILNALLAEIKAKKQLSGISDRVVIQELDAYFQKSGFPEIILGFNSQKQLKKNSVFRKAVKAVRAKLHNQFGMFQPGKTAEPAKIRLIEQAKTGRLDDSTVAEVLSSHLSTKERLQYYPFVYKSIFAVTGRPNSILDIGCGLNPVSLYYSGLKKTDYLACDIDQSGLKFVQQFFDALEINGKTVVADISKKDEISKLSASKYDLCFMFKILELDKRLAQPLITGINAGFIIASFSTVSLAGKIMANPRRLWFEKMLSRLKLGFSVFKTENEIFYCIKK